MISKIVSYRPENLEITRIGDGLPVEKEEKMEWELINDNPKCNGCYRCSKYALHKEVSNWALFVDGTRDEHFPAHLTPAEAQAKAEEFIREYEQKQEKEIPVQEKVNLELACQKAISLLAVDNYGHAGGNGWNSKDCYTPPCSPHIIGPAENVHRVYHGMNGGCGSQNKNSTVDRCIAVMNDGSLRFGDRHKVGECPYLKYDKPKEPKWPKDYEQYTMFRFQKAVYVKECFFSFMNSFKDSIHRTFFAPEGYIGINFSACGADFLEDWPYHITKKDFDQS